MYDTVSGRQHSASGHSSPNPSGDTKQHIRYIVLVIRLFRCVCNSMNIIWKINETHKKTNNGGEEGISPPPFWTTQRLTNKLLCLS